MVWWSSTVTNIYIPRIFVHKNFIVLYQCLVKQNDGYSFPTTRKQTNKHDILVKNNGIKNGWYIQYNVLQLPNKLQDVLLKFSFHNQLYAHFTCERWFIDHAKFIATFAYSLHEWVMVDSYSSVILEVLGSVVFYVV